MNIDENNRAPSNSLEGLRRRARLSARNRITNSRCAGVSRCGAVKELINKVQEERAVDAQEDPEAVDKVNKDKAPSKALEGLRMQVRLSMLGRTIGGWRSGALHCRVVEDRINEMQGGPKAVGCVDEGEVPSNTMDQDRLVRQSVELVNMSAPTKAKTMTTSRQQCQATGTVV